MKKHILWYLLDDLLKELDDKTIKFHQQTIIQRNFSISGKKSGSLWIHPMASGFAIELSGKSIIANMTPFMISILGEPFYGRPNTKNPVASWRTSNWDLIAKAIKYYSRNIV